MARKGYIKTAGYRSRSWKGQEINVVVNAEPGLIATIEAASPKSLNPLGGQGPKKYFAAVGVNTIRAVDDAITYLTERLKEEGVLIKATIKIDIDLSAAEATSLRERRDGKEVITTDQ